MSDLAPLAVIVTITTACALQGAVTARTPGPLTALSCAMSVVVVASLPGLSGVLGVLVVMGGTVILARSGAAAPGRPWPGESNVGIGICALGLGLSLVITNQLGLDAHSALLGLASGLLGLGVSVQLKTRAALQRGAALLVLAALLFAFGMIYSLTGALLGAALCAASFFSVPRSPGPHSAGRDAQRTH